MKGVISPGRGLLAMFAVLALFALPAAASASPAPESMLTDEIPVGFDAVDEFHYEGQEITAEAADDLACVQTASGSYCFDDVESADAAFADQSEESSGQAARLACAVDPLWEYDWAMYNSGGGAFSLYYIGGWIDYNTTNNNTTTSFQSGEASSIFSLYPQGGNARYSGPGTAYCGYQPDLRDVTWNGRNWNNRFTSRARIS